MNSRKFIGLVPATLAVFVWSIAAATLPVKDFGGGATANIEFWSPEQGWVGNPNALNRCDRVLFNFDLSGWIFVNRVDRAELTLALEPFGLADANEIGIELFTVERPVIGKLDLLAEETREIAAVTMTPEPPGVRVFQFDVTTEVNAALRRGEGTVGFRIRNKTVEARGNIRSRAEGVSVLPGRTVLEVTP